MRLPPRVTYGEHTSFFPEGIELEAIRTFVLAAHVLASFTDPAYLSRRLLGFG